MKLIIVVAFALVAVAVAAPPIPGPPQDFKTLRSDFETKPDGAYAYGFETENGIKQSETAELKEVVDEENKPHTVLVVRGSFSYPDPDGKEQVITYYADENGFHAEGDSVPKA